MSRRILAVGRKAAGAARYIVQVPARVEYGPVAQAAWADLPPVEGHRTIRAALEQVDNLTGAWRIVQPQPGRKLEVIAHYKECHP